MHKVQAPKWKDPENRFEFVGPDGKKTWLPLLKYIKPGLIKKLDGGVQLEIIEKLFEEYQPGLFDKFDDFDQISDLFNEWTAASGVDLGESSPSQD